MGVSVVYARLGSDGQADHQRGGGDGQGCHDPKADTPGHRGLLHSMRPAVADRWWFEAAAPTDGAASAGWKTPPAGQACTKNLSRS